MKWVNRLLERTWWRKLRAAQIRISDLEASTRFAFDELRKSQNQVDSLQRQVRHAAVATNEMAAHCRATEVAAAAARLQSQGVQVFGKIAGVGIEIPPLSSHLQKLVDSQPAQLPS